MKSEVSNRESLADIQEAMGMYNVSVAIKKGFKAFAKFARSEAGIEIWFSVIDCWVIHVGSESECKAFFSDFNSIVEAAGEAARAAENWPRVGV